MSQIIKGGVVFPRLRPSIRKSCRQNTHGITRDWLERELDWQKNAENSIVRTTLGRWGQKKAHGTVEGARLANKLRWYLQQPQRFIFTNLSEACCEAKRWKYLSWVCTKPSQTFSRPCWTWPGSAPKPPRPSPDPCLTWPGKCCLFDGASGDCEEWDFTAMPRLIIFK